MSAVDLDMLLAANRQVLAELDRKAARVEDRAVKARAVLQDCDVERHEIDEERKIILAADVIYRRQFVPGDQPDGLPMPPPDSQPALEMPGTKKPRARIGPQRFRILVHAHKNPAIAADEEQLAAMTHLPVRRVKSQVRSDLSEGILIASDGKLELTPVGRDLLERFINYKRERGEPLPSLTGPVAEDDNDGEEEDETDIAA